MKQMKKKDIIAYVAIIAVFVALAYGFVPQVLQGKVVNQSDITGWRGMAQETLEWNAAHPGDKTCWTDGMFGGMPNVTILDDFQGDWTKPLYKTLLWGKRPASYLLIALLGAFLMMLSMGVDKFLAAAGAVAVAFCAYNFQIIQVGHNTKMQAIAFAPWAVAALIFTYRSALEKGRDYLPRTILGAVLFALALSLQIKANHIQITYYLAIIILTYAVCTLASVLLKKDGRRRQSGRFAIASALLLVLGLTGIATNANKLLPTYDYTPYTMRGGSELTREGSSPDTGLDIAYATAWSYGIEETPNLLIPNFNGGSSNGSLGEKSATWNLFKRAGQNPRQICRSLPLYWGPQPFTAGPMYIGAISIFLFILGLFLLEDRHKWWLVICTVLAVLLSWGNHFLPFTELWFKYAPFYNKFRTVSMALVTLQICVPLMGIYTLDRILKGDFQGRKVVRSIWWSLGLAGGFCALFALLPSLAGTFTAASDSGMQEVIASALQEDRRHLLQADAWRSFLLITASAATLMFCYMPGKDSGTGGKRPVIATAIIGVMILLDLWSVGKRYLNEGHFMRERDFSTHFDKRAVDDEILKDKAPSYRVLDLSVSTFNDSFSSYYHKSIGGYSPTKMQRYQDLIDHYLSGEISSFYKAAGKASTLQDIQDSLPYMPCISMLNGKYVIISGDYPPVENKYAFGPCWIAQNAILAQNADQEIALLGQVDPKRTAVVRNACVAEAFAATEAEADVESSISLTSYAPNELHYSYSCSKPSLALFSEIYHPSWKASVNGEPAELFAANWVLRGAVLPEGSGEIVMEYRPEDYVTGRNVSRASSILLLVLLAASVGYCIVPKKKEE